MAEVSGPHMDCLAGVGSVQIQEQVNVLEAITAIIGQEIEMANKYKVLDESGNEILFAVEETDCITRQVKQCFPDCAPWNVSMFYTQGGNNMKVLNMQRDWTCTCCCFNRPVVNVTDVTSGQKLGSIQDPFACCDLTFNIRDPEENTVLKANGGCCQWGLCFPLPCGPCAEVNFPVVDANTDKEVGFLKKKVPGCCKFFLAPDVDNFDVSFNEVQHPQYKALLIALAIFMDFRYFNENPNDDQGGIIGAVMGEDGE